MGMLDQAKSALPGVNMGTVGSFVFWIVIVVLVLIIVGGFVALWAWWYISKRRFNKTIRIFEKVDGRYKPTIVDVAMERKMGKGGDTVFFLKKQKRIVPTPSIQTGINTFWFAKREDGELINIGMEDIDLKMREAKVNYLDKETRYARASLQKLNKDRFNQETWWGKYGKDVMGVIYIVIISIMLLLLMGKFLEVTGRLDTIMVNSETIIEKATQAMGALDNVCSNSGIVVT